MYQPLEQFEIFFLGFFASLTISNATYYIFFGKKILHSIFNMVFFDLRIKPSSLQLIIEKLFDFLLNLTKQQMSMTGYLYFPMIFSLFITIMIYNLIGMTLYSFTITSHVVVAFTLSFVFFIAIVLTGIIIQKKKFVDTFIPSGAPKIIKPFLIGIEIISYFSRPFSLGIRLFANLMAGHTLLAILSGFAFLISKKNIFAFLLPLIMILAIVGLEVMICLLQAYVFTVLVCIYYNDSVHGSH
jgi:F-type H+-transporting ATPase subunit a